MNRLAKHSILENQNIPLAQFLPKRPDGTAEQLKWPEFAVPLDALHIFQFNIGALGTSRRRKFNDA
jgi:hypothetical protein